MCRGVAINTSDRDVYRSDVNNFEHLQNITRESLPLTSKIRLCLITLLSFLSGSFTKI